MNPYRDPGRAPSPEIIYVQRSYSFGLAALVGAVCFIAGTMTNCISRQAQEAMADSTFLADQMRCVDANDTRETIDACRRAVRERWGIAETIRDGGRQ